MTIEKDIINIINEKFSHKSDVEKSDLLNISLYRIMKESKYFDGRYDCVKLNLTKMEETDNKLINFGIKKFNNVKGYTNQQFKGWNNNFEFIYSLKNNGKKNYYNSEFSDYEDYSGFELDYGNINVNSNFLLTNEDENLINKIINLLDKSKNFYDFFDNTLIEIEKDPEFLYKIKYLYPEKNVFDFVYSFLNIPDKLKQYEFEKQNKNKIYYNLNSFLFEEYISRDDFYLLKSNSDVEIDKKSDLLAKSGHPNYINKVNYIILNSKNDHIKETIDSNIYQKERLFSKILFKQFLKIENENKFLNKYEEESDFILESIKLKYPILDNKKTKDIKITHLNSYEKYISDKDLPKQNWTLGDWNLDKMLITDFLYTDFQYISESNHFNNDYFIVTNDLEDIIIANINYADYHKRARLSSISGIENIENKNIIKDTIFHIFNWLQDKNILSLKLDFADMQKSHFKSNPNLFNTCIQEIIAENDYNFLIYGDYSDLTFGQFNEIFNDIFDLDSYYSESININNIKEIKEIQKKMLKDFNDNYYNKDLTREEKKNIIEKYTKKYIKSDRVNKWKI